MSFDIRECKYNFSTDNINIIVLVYDYSGSMGNHVNAMKEANIAFYNDFSKFEEKGSIAISKVLFNNYIEMTSFKSVKDFDTGYYANGGTRLYEAITHSANNTKYYYNEIVKRLNIRPRITYLVFSDGEDSEESTRKRNEARETVKSLNLLDATTVFVAFDEAINSEIGSKLGFSCIRNITTVRELVSCLGTELSKSCKEQSKSAYSLKSQFFSNVAETATDSKIEQVLFDDDFFNV
ncbi:MAG: VWA domain-containing protein [Clostridia bacterium]|nr:VWA domain-containing protein [Clostridia bacterium]